MEDNKFVISSLTCLWAGTNFCSSSSHSFNDTCLFTFAFFFLGKSLDAAADVQDDWSALFHPSPDSVQGCAAFRFCICPAVAGLASLHLVWAGQCCYGVDLTTASHSSCSGEEESVSPTLHPTYLLLGLVNLCIPGWLLAGLGCASTHCSRLSLGGVLSGRQ